MDSKKMKNKKIYNALDLFSGAGGFSVGMKHAGINVVASVEYNSNIAETYRYNNPKTHLIVDDIRKIKASKKENDIKVSLENSKHESIEEIFHKKGISCDIIFGGPPCQGFSMAGNRIRSAVNFLEDDRNYLFKEFIRMVKYLKPKVFVIENVTGILNYNEGTIKNDIYNAFKELGYDIHAEVLCAANYGVPQTRNRAFFIGNNIGLNSADLFPKSTHSEDTYVSVLDAISDLPMIESGEGIDDVPYPTDVALTEYQIRLRNPEGIIYNHISSKHKSGTIELLKMIKEGQTMKNLPERYRTKSVHSGAYGRMQGDCPAYTLTTRINTPSVGRITHPKQHRTITPREAARIQSFPDNYKFLGNITSLGIQIGNAVPPILAESIGKHIIKVLNN